MSRNTVINIFNKLIFFGNFLFIIWLLLNGINEDFGNIVIESVPYFALLILFILNIVVFVEDYIGQRSANGESAKKLRKSTYFIIGLITITVTLLISSLVYLKSKYPTTKPFKSAEYIYEARQNPHKQMSLETIGFLPYWRMDDAKYIKYNLLSEVIYFSLTADETGNIVKVVDNETDPGWRWWTGPTVKDLIARTQISGTKFSIAVAMQKNDTLESFLDNPGAQKNLTSNLLELITENKLDGLNIDFEYAGDIPDDSYRDKFTQFSTTLSTEFRSKSPSTKLSIDFYPISVRKPKLFDIPKLAPLFDRIIVMSYDYYGPGSPIAGPVAPMGGFEEDKYFFDVSTTYKDYLEVVPKEKLVMGVPYYAWDYPVQEGDQPMAKVLPQNDINGYTSVMSYGRMRSNPDIKPENCIWDDLAKQNWCTYQDNKTGKFRQVWIEDNQSIGVKFDYAKSNQLGGVALWTLGYDKDYPDLWDMINSKFTN